MRITSGAIQSIDPKDRPIEIIIRIFIFFCKNFGGWKGQCTGRLLELMRSRPARFDRCKSEITNFDSQVVVQENVVALKITVNNIFGVKITRNLQAKKKTCLRVFVLLFPSENRNLLHALGRLTCRLDEC